MNDHILVYVSLMIIIIKALSCYYAYKKAANQFSIFKQFMRKAHTLYFCISKQSILAHEIVVLL